MKKVIILLPYFGNFPNYFQLFLNSCGYNSDFDFVIFSDQDCALYKFNKNIRFIKMNFKEMQDLSLKKLKIKEAISSPYKLCDFRPAYGVLFDEYIRGYDYWGFCDCDLIFGDLTPVLKLLNDGYDKILSNGHLSLIKNSIKMNNLYKLKIKNGISFDEVITIKEPCFFDEIFFPFIIKKEKYNIYENKLLFADILPQHSELTMPQDNIKRQKFLFDNGCVKRFNDNKQYIYIHLQKRKMNVNIDLLSKKYIINSNSFDYNPVENANSSLLYKIRYYKKIIASYNLKKIIIKIKTIIFKRR